MKKDLALPIGMINSQERCLLHLFCISFYNAIIYCFLLFEGENNECFAPFYYYFRQWIGGRSWDPWGSLSSGVLSLNCIGWEKTKLQFSGFLNGSLSGVQSPLWDLGEGSGSVSLSHYPRGPGREFAAAPSNQWAFFSGGLHHLCTKLKWRASGQVSDSASIQELRTFSQPWHFTNVLI